MRLSTSFRALTLSSIVAASLASSYGNQLPLNPGLASLKIPGDNPLNYCDDSYKENLLHFEYINLDPNPPVKAKNLTIVAAGTLDQTIEEGAYVKIEIRYGFIKIWGGTVDLCEQSPTVNEECPIKKGTRKVSKVVEMPKDIPPGTYKVFADARTKDDDRLTCFTAEITFPV